MEPMTGYFWKWQRSYWWIKGLLTDFSCCLQPSLAAS
uniref:Uncharacterized protein n=1 Tax=Anguilla anguilla TaxID=7936 RepID=A0A0E9S3D4_ANGAN